MVDPVATVVCVCLVGLFHSRKSSHLKSGREERSIACVDKNIQDRSPKICFDCVRVFVYYDSKLEQKAEAC